ncbi:MAG: peptide ABC transporter [Candidatus Wallbacteria bacterium HGW-Wallbacteria-1]|jgi:ABC-type dipeptide/oligopeptide/nickel transport system permease component|uniref:Peptide ABC transporter n=1 Tax=Candidatus Wallbacteria bacterium HGW-Wallbacteria-1 TaxID=2013854 RepID=A0A2N1PSC1_9BACT|nr:MAG: peptide ABC transporter [Candidatus Wallbacteria bacterium HGW-Wallbacteria-1]
MGSFILRRVIALFPVLLGISLITFTMMYVLPGDPALFVAGERADDATIRALRQEMGLDRSLSQQYLHFLGRTLRGDLGRSIITGRDVQQDIIEYLPNTLKLAMAAILVSTITGITMGVLAAVWRGTLLDHMIMLFSLVGVSTPIFFSAMIAIYVFAVILGILPPSGTGDGSLRYLILPALTLGIRSGAFLTRITRTSMLEVLQMEYVRAARARGVCGIILHLRHSLRNALVPVITVIGLDFSSYLNGSVITETIFSWPGIGRYIMVSITKRDLPAISASVLVCACVFVLVNLAVDILYGYLNPKLDASSQNDSGREVA